MTIFLAPALAIIFGVSVWLATLRGIRIGKRRRTCDCCGCAIECRICRLSQGRCAQ